MYVNMKYILDNANRDGYAVMAINCVNMEMARAAIEAAEEEHSPIIVQFGVGQMSKLAHPTEMVPMIKDMAERASVPVCLNLDHGPSFEAEVEAIKRGFSNVMIDASSLPYEENVRRTRMIVDLAHAKGISVEAELGHVGQAADGDGKTSDMYTNVEQAVEFVKETGCDALAVAIGTAHGKYPEGYVPVLDFNRLAELKAALKMPLVLHGGSGSGEENIRKAVAGGINKINVCTDAFHAAEKAMKAKWEAEPNTDFLNIMMVAEKAVKEFVRDYIRLIGSNNRYTFEAADNGSKE
ncbi:MAG: class II fructose-bisphosphate aldolase [Erysipelotrichaceae bacterium]|jgi:fructose-bisphosphate aldolase class II|nr:class II fructose-bisphosphate aldolase [Erysipelotrichaceae bacterium]MCR5095251.1 class II fructose-bisphosphate aldolase [Erysipelotrichaceae bacterium]